MSKKRRLLYIAVLLVTSFGIVWYLKSNRDLLSALTHVSLAQACWLAVLRVLFLMMNGLFLRTFAGKFQVQLKPVEWLGLAFVTTMGNYIAPFSGGTVARAAYLKNRHRFPYARFVTLLASSYLMTFWVIGVVGGLALLTFGKALWAYWQLLVFFVAVVVLISGLILFPAVRLPGKNRIAKTVNTALAGWILIKNDRILLARLVAYTLINVFLNSLSFWVAYDTVGTRISFRSALLVGLLASFSLLIGITPGNLGIQEAVVSLSSGLLGIGTGEGLLAALLIRGTTLIPTFILGPIFSFLLTRKLAMPRDTESPVSVKERPQ
jgi:uncharacterized membrane protein YbhN (UPF0104 family)